MKRSILHIGNTGARIRIFIFLFILSYMYMYGNDDIENIDGLDNSLLLSKINQYRETYINDVYGKLLFKCELRYKYQKKKCFDSHNAVYPNNYNKEQATPWQMQIYNVC